MYFHPYLYHLTSNIWFSNNIELNRQSFVIIVPWVSLVLTPENKLLWQWPFLFFFKCCAIAKDEASALCFKGYFSCYRWLVDFFNLLFSTARQRLSDLAFLQLYVTSFTFVSIFCIVFVVCNSVHLLIFTCIYKYTKLQSASVTWHFHNFTWLGSRK